MPANSPPPWTQAQEQGAALTRLFDHYLHCAAATGADLRTIAAQDQVVSRWEEWARTARDVGSQTRQVLCGVAGGVAAAASTAASDLHRRTGPADAALTARAGERQHVGGQHQAHVGPASSLATIVQAGVGR